MGEYVLEKADLRQMELLCITEPQVRGQIELFEKSSFYLHLKKPCTLQSGVRRIPAQETDRYLRLHDEAVKSGRYRKFVPASGAATRMFQSLLQIYYSPRYLEFEELQRRAEQGDSKDADLLRFINEIRRFPFSDDLDAALSKDGLALDALIKLGEFRNILDYLLTARGLNYAFLPKGLLKFHKYPTECRTAFEEQLVEAMHYASSGFGTCGVHFTISPQHETAFRQLYEEVKARYKERFGTLFEVDFSFQKPSTDTIAVDLENRPFRDQSGLLHFRPGGHGALLENLNDLQGDIVYVKNIDNLCPDHLKATGSLWKKVLGGYLVEVQRIAHDFIRKLMSGEWYNYLAPAAAFAAETLLIDFPRDYGHSSNDYKREFVVGKLNRPIRVCGVVLNEGHPGGAPFWVEDKCGQISIQIVEEAQVDCGSPDQRDIWMSSTHFNPVDLVCALKDFEGKSFDLMRYTNPDAILISKKSKDGKDLKALELPGLWNGAMADWNTIIVEVPAITFNPVKTIFDLLRPEHQPERA
ncbi:MAG: DUF4301 family protein [Syntrophobacteraceae bacterium]